MSHSLLDRARSLLQSGAPAMLALAIVPLAGVTPAAAAAVSNSDLQVQYSGAYFYNSSGFFSDWATAPAGGAQNTTNADGSPKLYGSATATSDDFYAHNMRRDGAGDPWYFNNDGGIVMVWGGTLRAAPGAGDMLNIYYDFSADVAAPGAGASYFLSAYLGAYQPSNFVGSALVGGWTDSSSGPVVGDVMSQPLNEWDIVDQATYYWQIVVGVSGESYASGQTWNGVRYNLYPGLALNVPANSIDVRYASASAVVPEPGTALLVLGGLLPLLLLKTRATRSR